jgi:hypothetical protein
MDMGRSFVLDGQVDRRRTGEVDDHGGTSPSMASNARPIDPATGHAIRWSRDGLGAEERP